MKSAKVEEASETPRDDREGVAAVSRALAILHCFQPGDVSLSLADLAKRTEMHKSTLLRLLASLEQGRLARRLPDGRYALGHEVARLNSIYTESFSLASAVIPILKELVEHTGECAALYVRQGNLRLCLHRVDSPHLLRDHTRVGDLLPLDRGSGGHLVMAYTGGTSPLHQKIRREHLVITTGELLPELSGISAPAFDAGGKFVGAINLSIPTYRFNISHAPFVQAAAVKLTETLGGTYPQQG